MGNLEPGGAGGFGRASIARNASTGLSPSTTHADTRAVAVGMQRHIIVDRSGSPQHTPQPLRALARHKRRTDLDGREP
jgi:hypothetical protein